jgi:hypothetical protein
MRAESFGFKNAWIAVKDTDPQTLAGVLSLRNVRSCDWQSGIAAAYLYPTTCSVFVTPAIDRWVLCVGFPLFTPVEARPPEFGNLAADWAAKLQREVQYFATHRVVESHGWVRALPDGLRRAYLYVGESGEKVLDEGTRTADEEALGFSFFDPEGPDAQSDDYWQRTDLTSPAEEHVMMLAARWSVDPSAFTERELEVGDGLVGDYGEPTAALPEPPPPTKRRWKFW